MEFKNLKNVAHRGVHLKHPENSLPGICLAGEMGLDGVEFDIWLTKDHVPIVAHGLSSHSAEKAFNLKTNQNEVIFLNDLTLEELSSSYRMERREYRFATFQEIVDYYKNSSTRLYIEIKDYRKVTIDKVLEILKRENFRNFIILSFDFQVRKWIQEWPKKGGFKVNIGYLVNNHHVFESFETYKKIFQPGDNIIIDVQMVKRKRSHDLEMINRLLNLGYELGVYLVAYFNNQEGPELYREVLRLGASFLINDKPDRLITSKATCKQ